MKLFVFFGLLVGISAVSAQMSMVRFDNFKVYHVKVQNEEQLKTIKKLQEDLDVQVTRSGYQLGGTFEVVVSPEKQKVFEERLHFFEFIFDVIIQDLQDRVEEFWKGVCKWPKENLDWTKYHKLDTIYKWLDRLALRKPFQIKSYTIGKSYEGRPIKAIKYSERKGNKAIFIDSNIHAIEWISSATSTCFFDKLINSKDKQLRRLAANYDWIFVPMVNPDGFVYSHDVHPLWRKNRKPTGFSNSSGICYGVDLNRNFDYHFGEAGYNLDVPCDHWYAGAKADSEPEVVALEEFLKSFPEGYIRMYQALHSYGNLVLYPYGHTEDEELPNKEQVVAVAQAFVDSAEKVHGTEFLHGSSGQILYPVSGTAKDWTYGVLNIPYSVTIELRDTGKYGFFLPAEQIIPVCEEFTAGLIASVKTAELNGIFD